MEERNEIIEGLNKNDIVEFTDFESSPSVVNLLKSLLEFHKLMENEKIIFDSTNPFYKSGYLSLSGLIEIITPKLNQAGIVIMQMPMERNGNIFVNTRMYHAE